MKQGFQVKEGFDAYISGQVPVGSGLSSSAAFEVLIACVLNGLFGEDSFLPMLWLLQGNTPKTPILASPAV